ncbi:FHA domain-containing protein [Microbulbifer marinus]|uniref:Inner membrane component of T3SS domain-containing protein n=1 Tax=Microbulbifer marinus TaxID=658218 RepID=A0A1H3VW85_9GAMM|nr:FHA domain-containing protein [Microbulbifer marinus]SDZ79039.1 Inner membrane component of T3SS domain-containing protein [Microbulbifer marinus]
MFKLCDLKDASSSVWLVAPKVTIGRAASCDLTIADDSVAKLHAEIAVEGDSLTLHNLSGSGQILLNGKPVKTRSEIRLNDQLQIGGRVLKVVDPKVTKLRSAAPASSVAWALRANHPAIAGKVFPVKETTVVGRSDECDITFSLSHLSRRHARLEVREGLLFVTDLGSANGTYLNNKRIVETRVRRGDELRFDTLSFSVVGPADDLDKTTVRPAISMPQIKAVVQEAREAVDRPSPASEGGSTQERQKFEGSSAIAEEGGSSGWIWVTGLLLTAAALGYFWARNQGLL